MTNLTANQSKRLISSNFKQIVENNVIKTNPYLTYNPLINERIAVNDNHRKTDPILDKLDSNKFYFLINAFNNTTIKPMNGMFFPDLTTFRDINQKNRRITDSETETKEIKEMPSANKPIKMYLDYRIIRDPRSYTHLTIIRRHKMNKHKRKKWRKKMLAFLKRKYLKRNIKTEKLFRAELLAQIKDAEEFDAEKYVRNILETIDNVPKPETRIQKIERIRELMRKNRRETNFMSPKFD